MSEQKDTYTVEPGRHIYRNGEPLFSLNCTKPFAYSEIDAITHVVCALLNRRQPKPDERS